jgi:uncharacterized protein (DUF1810 family)
MMVVGTSRRAAFVSTAAWYVPMKTPVTLFHRAAPEESLFVEVLERCHGGVPGPATDRLLAAS